MTPTPQQAQIIEAFGLFLTRRTSRDVMVINGYAGTGKTTVVGTLVRALVRKNKRPVLLAPTGRAAKVAASFAGITPSTIHHAIYRPADSSPGCTHLVLRRNKFQDTIFFVDEASMITDSPGTGPSLLADLITFVYSAPGCALVLIGDQAQLPPVGQPDSPAMRPERLRQLGLNPIELTLDIPVRQALDSGLLANATAVRRCIGTDTLPKLLTEGLPDVTVITPDLLEERLTSSWRNVGGDQTILVTRSNYRANAFNAGVRNRILQYSRAIERGEKLIIAKNNYLAVRDRDDIPFLANGDVIHVEWVGTPEKMYGRFFVDIDFRLAGSREVLSAKVMLRSLAAEGAAIPTAEMAALYQRVAAKYADLPLSKQMKAMDEDPWLNALQVKYAYAVTCHKAQGGQWEHVYIDLSGLAPEALDDSFLRWLYTAVTRARRHLYLISPPAYLLATPSDF